METFAAQGQAVGQFNLNGQFGAAIASATSGDVYVDQSGNLTAGAGGVFGDGITAKSNAVAVAKIEQDSEQKNKNEAAFNLQGPTTNAQQQQQQQQQVAGPPPRSTTTPSNSNRTRPRPSMRLLSRSTGWATEP